MTEAEVERRLQSVGSQRFFRVPPSSDPAVCKAIYTAANSQEKCLNFIYLWGAHKKPATNSYESQALLFISGLLATLSRVFEVRTAITFVICDSHGIANMAAPEAVESYASDICIEFAKYGWASRRLSEVLDCSALDGKSMFETGFSFELDTMAIKHLQRGAKKNFLGKDSEEGWQRYLKIRLGERQAIADTFAGSIVLSPAQPYSKFYQPALPIMWIWSLGRRKTSLPWFMSNDLCVE